MFSFLLPTLTLTCFWSQWQNPPPPSCEKHFTQSIHLLFLLDPGGRVSFVFFFFLIYFMKQACGFKPVCTARARVRKPPASWPPPWGFDPAWDPSCQKRTPRHAGRYTSRNKQVTEHVSSVLGADYLIIHSLFHNCFGLLTNLCMSPVALFKYVIDQNI